jgi:hypothetical protein
MNPTVRFKQLLILSLLVLNILTFMVPNVIRTKAQEQRQVLMRVEPAILTVDVGETFNVTVKIYNVPKELNLILVQFNLTWDVTILNAATKRFYEVLFNSLTPPEEKENILKISNTAKAGYALYSYTWLNVSGALEKGYAPIYGNQTVAILTLKAIASGRTTIKFDSILLGGYDPVTKTYPTIVDYPWKPLPTNFNLVGAYVAVGFLIITVESPKNVTYNAIPINLTFTVSKPPQWVGYSLDGGANVTIAGNTTISPNEGLHYLIIYANDTSGKIGVSDIIYFTVDVTPPVAVFSYSIKGGIIYGTYKWNITFNASESYDTLTGIDSYNWDFGDGFTGKGAVATHLYRKPGIYNVTLIVKDFANNISTKVVAIKLTEPTDIPWWVIISILIPIAWFALGFFLLKKKFPKKMVT